MGDANRLQQIVWNLLSNAIKFTPIGGLVKIFLRNDGNHLVFEITDTGQGINPEFLPFIFDRFRQADGTSTRQHGGLGLGLAIVRQSGRIARRQCDRAKFRRKMRRNLYDQISACSKTGSI